MGVVQSGGKQKMSSVCTCHVDKDKCFCCKVRVGTFQSNSSQGVTMVLPNGKELEFHTHDIKNAFELADALMGNVVKLDIPNDIQLDKLNRIKN
ncbi:hypothetical protein COD84_24500 [Bacillus cereus]|nr:hypothetical protein COD84_24500 [Bacillus cereus]